MKIPAIKKLVETYTKIELLTAESAISEGKSPEIDVEGEDEGEQLTHVIAAAWILQEMNSKNMDFKTALREYTQKVRNSIS